MRDWTLMVIVRDHYLLIFLLSWTDTEKRMSNKHLIVKRGVQLVLPAAQEMQELKKLLDSSSPPQTTSLPPDRRERLCSLLG